jgi:hypothetical protein
MDLESVSGYHPLGEHDTAKVAARFGISDLVDEKQAL